MVPGIRGAPDDDFVFVVEDLDGPGGLIGQASLYHIDWGAGCAEFGRLLIGESAARGRGLGLRGDPGVVGVRLRLLWD